MAVFVYRLVDPSSLTMFSNIFTIVFFAKSSSKFLRAEKKNPKSPHLFAVSLSATNWAAGELSLLQSGPARSTLGLLGLQ